MLLLVLLLLLLLLLLMRVVDACICERSAVVCGVQTLRAACCAQPARWWWCFLACGSNGPRICNPLNGTGEVDHGRLCLAACCGGLWLLARSLLIRTARAPVNGLDPYRRKEELEQGKDNLGTSEGGGGASSTARLQSRFFDEGIQVEVKGSDSLQEEENERGGMTAFFLTFGEESNLKMLVERRGSFKSCPRGERGTSGW